jgi:hypothetical protein
MPGSLSRRLSRVAAALPPSGASAGSVTMASLDSARARRTPATSAAAGPPPGGSSVIRITGRATSRTGPTTTTITCSGRDASARSRSGWLSTCSANLSGGKRCDAPPARTTAVTRGNEDWLLVGISGAVAECLLTCTVDAGSRLGSRRDLDGVVLHEPKVLDVIVINRIDRNP